MAKQLKTGLIQATNEIDVQRHKPLFFGYLKAYLDKYLKNPVDMQFMEKLENIDRFDIIGISSTSQDFSRAIEIARTVKECRREIITIIGGHHITNLPNTLPQEFDIGVIGEGEETFLELVGYFSGHPYLIDKINKEELKNINGIVFREGGNIVITEKRELIYPLDKILFPYRARGTTPYIFSSRGCPYKCTFCSSSVFWEKVRFFSAEYVVQEIEQILEQFSDINNIPIWDDLFIANLPRFKRIVALVEKKGINKKVRFSFAVRSNLINEDLCQLLKKLNVAGVSFGAESGSDRILKLLNKGSTVKQNQKSLDILHKYQIPVLCSFVIGVPTETEEEVRLTYEFILKNIVEGKMSPNPAVNILMPMPGTGIWDYAVKKGLIDIRNMDWKRLSVFASYRDSNINDFVAWVDYRRENNSIYLAEETLPQEKLYQLMYVYEETLNALEKNRELQEKERALHSILTSKTWKLTAPIRKVVGFFTRKDNV